MDRTLGLNAQVGVLLSQEWGQEDVIVSEYDRICTPPLTGHIKYFRVWCKRRVTLLAVLPPELPDSRYHACGIFTTECYLVV